MSPWIPNTVIANTAVEFPWFNVKDHGATGDGVTDDSSAVQAALTAAGAVASGGRTGALVFVPTGVYACQSLSLPEHVSILGVTPGSSELTYNGPGGTDTYLMSIDGGTSFARINHLSMSGYGGGGGVADYVLTTTYAPDLNFQIEDMAFTDCIKNAIHFPSTGWTNLHLERVRFDGVGGYCILLKTLAGMENFPFSIRNWTLDNVHSQLPSPYGEAVSWGQGLLRIVADGHNTTVGTINVENGRVELNDPIDTQTKGAFTNGETPAIIYLEHEAGAGTDYIVDLANVLTSGVPTGNPFLLATDNNGQTQGVIRNCHGILGIYKDGYNAARDMTFKTCTFAVLHDSLSPTGGSMIYSGVESPVGNLGAKVGSIYLRHDGGAGTTFYVKESGTDETGWVAK